VDRRGRDRGARPRGSRHRRGLRASRVGDAGLYLLARGDGGRVGLVGPRGRYLLDADDPDRLRAPDGGDPLVVRLAGLGPRRLRRAVLEAAGSW